jgi:hypothetical protein
MAPVMRIFSYLLMAVLAVSLTSGPTVSKEYYSKREIWNRLTGGHLNISSFAFRDINRNGVFDMNDRPMVGVVFKLTGGGKAIVRRTNKAGFANFSMSVRDKDQDIVNPGEYEFVAVPPPGWTVTTDNVHQEAVFEVMPGAPADMFSNNPQQPVGLAQELTINGRISQGPEALPVSPIATPAGDGLRLLATGPEGEEEEVVVNEAGTFSFPVQPGTWTIGLWSDSGEITSQRSVDVSDASVALATLMPGENQLRTTERIITVNFDDLASAGILEIPFGYAGLNWHNWVATHHKHYSGEGYVNTTTSGEFVAYNSSGHPVRITRDHPFDFIGGYFGSAWLRAEGETLIVRGWRGDILAYDEEISLSALGPVYFSANFEGVTRLEFETEHYWQFVADDMQFSFPD